MKIQILLYNGFDDLDAIAPHEVFKKAEDQGANFSSTLVSLQAPAKILSSSALQLEIENTFDLKRCDLLVVPGGGWANRSAQGAWKEFQEGKIPAAIQQAHTAGKIIASVCTGALLLAKAGLLKGRPASTHHSARSDLENMGVKVRTERVVDDGEILSAGGITSGIDLALWILERFGSTQIQKQISQQLEYERSINIWQKP